jgi:hypothetical protein
VKRPALFVVLVMASLLSTTGPAHANGGCSQWALPPGWIGPGQHLLQSTQSFGSCTPAGITEAYYNICHQRRWDLNQPIVEYECKGITYASPAVMGQVLSWTSWCDFPGTTQLVRVRFWTKIKNHGIWYYQDTFGRWAPSYPMWNPAACQYF